MSDTVFDLSDGRQITSSNTKFSELPNLVTKDNLIGVKIGNQVTSFSDIFKKCEKLKSVTFIPTSQVSVIGNYAFSSCTALQSVTIPDSVISIGDNAFVDCIALQSVTIPDSVTSIGRSTFFDCRELQSVTIPDSVTSISDQAFSGSALQSVTIPDSVTSIGNSAFGNCFKLDNVTIGNSVTSIGKSVFEGCIVLQSVTIPDSVTSIGISAFVGCSKLLSVTIGNGLTVIPFNTFSECEQLNSVIIGNSVQKIDDRAFGSCTALQSLTIPDSVTEIRYFVERQEGIEAAFYDSGIKTLYMTKTNGLKLEEGTKSIGGISEINIIFNDAVNFYINDINSTPIKLNVGEKLTTESYSNINSVTKANIVKVEIPEDSAGVKTIDTNAFSSCGKLKEVIIGNSVTSIGISVFQLSKSLESVIIPDSVTSIGDSAFKQCWELQSVTIPNKVETIGEYAFEGCLELNPVTIGDSVNSIGEFAFSRCVKLQSVTIPDSVTSIGDQAFSSCIVLKNVTIGNGLDNINKGTFVDCIALESVTIGNKVQKIDDGAFAICTALQSLTIPDSVTNIVYTPRVTGTPLKSAFRDSTINILYMTSRNGLGYSEGFINLGALNPLNVKFTDKTKFYVNDIDSTPIEMNIVGELTISSYQNKQGITLLNLVKVEIGGQVTSIGNYAFSGCGALQSVTIGDYVTSIGKYAFERCSELQSVTIGDGVTTDSIGEYAFFNCDNLSKINFYSNKFSIISGESRGYPFYGSPTNVKFYILQPKTKFITNNNITYETSANDKGEIVIPNDVTKNNLQSLFVGSDVKKIKEQQFKDYTNLSILNLQGATQLDFIGWKAFYGCVNLNKKHDNITPTNLNELIIIPKKIHTIGKSAFETRFQLVSGGELSGEVTSYYSHIYVVNEDKYDAYQNDNSKFPWVNRENTYFFKINSTSIVVPTTTTSNKDKSLIISKPDNINVIGNSVYEWNYKAQTNRIGDITYSGTYTNNATSTKKDFQWKDKSGKMSKVSKSNKFGLKVPPNSSYRIEINADIHGDIVKQTFDVSNKTSSDNDDDLANCFPGNSRLILKDGTKKIFHEIQPGDEIQVCSKEMDLFYSKVTFLPHLENDMLATFIKFTTKSNQSIYVTSKHYLPVLNKNNTLQNVMAQYITKEDKLYVLNNGMGTPEEIDTIKKTVEKGTYTCYVKEGEYIVVDNVVASPFGISYEITKNYSRFLSLVDNIGLLSYTNSFVRVGKEVVISFLKNVGLMDYFISKK